MDALTLRRPKLASIASCFIGPLFSACKKIPEESIAANAQVACNWVAAWALLSVV